MNEENDKTDDEEVKGGLKDFDDMLKLVGGWGPFQYLLVIIFFPFNIFLGYVYLSPILTVFTPPHWCSIPDLMNLTMEERKKMAIPLDIDTGGGYSQCRQYITDWSKVHIEESEGPDESWPVGPCSSGWEYDLEDFHTSVTVEFDWVCEQAWIPALSQTIFFFGAIPGMLFFGWFSDTIGRLPTIMCSNILALVTGVLTPFITGHLSFFALRFAMGLAFNTFFTAPYILVLEYVDCSKRTLVGNLGLALFLTLSGVYQPWAIKYIGDWKVFNWVMFSQMVLVLVVPLILPESGRWLMIKGREEKLLKILRRIANMNKRELPENFDKDVRSLCKKQLEMNSSKPSHTYADLFKNPNMRRITILGIILWMIISLVFDTTVRNISNLNFNFYISFMIATLMELPADLLSIVGMNWLGRRWSSFIPMIGCAATMLACAWLTDWWQAQAGLFMLGRVFATYAMNLGFQFTVEVMPTDLRGQGTALMNVMSMVSQMASPYIVYSAVLSDKAPFIIIAIITVIGAFPGLFLPETAGINLPDSLEEIEEFGKNDKFFWMPLFKSTPRYKESVKDSCCQVGEDADNMAFTEV